MMKKLTIRKLNNMRKAIDKWAEKWGLRSSTYSIYMGGYRYFLGDVADIIKPWDVCDGYNENFIFGMGVDGDTYDAARCTDNFWLDANKELHGIFHKYGLDYDFVDTCHLTAYLLDDSTEVEYQYGKTVAIGARESVAPKIIRAIMDKWDALAYKVGDKGTCAWGAFLSFTFKGLKYRASVPRYYQGNLSWEEPLPEIRSLLKKFGAENIIYHGGYMD